MYVCAFLGVGVWGWARVLLRWASVCVRLRRCAGLFCGHVGENVRCFREQVGSVIALPAGAGSQVQTCGRGSWELATLIRTSGLGGEQGRGAR